MVFGLSLNGRHAFAATPIEGLYVFADPYDSSPTGGKTLLNTAANATTCAGAEPFCTDTNGILLNVDWCRFEGYPDANSPVTSTGVHKNFSCHYYLTAGAGSKQYGTQVVLKAEDTHNCPVANGKATSYDECSGSDLVLALSNIVKINAIRASLSTPLPPLRLSLALMAGLGTPETYFLDPTIGFLSIPFPAISGPICGAEPQVWTTNFVSAYTKAYDEFISYIAAHSGNSPIKLVKVTPLNSATLEYFLPGSFETRPYDGDRGSPDPDDVSLDCSGATGAQKWIDAYSVTGFSSLSVIQSMERTFGTVVGNLYATVLNTKNTDFGISVATNDVKALPEINCGLNSAGSGTSHLCSPQLSAQEQWSLYYLFLHASHLYPPSGTTVALAAANAAAVSAGQPSFALPRTSFFVNTTQLQDPTPNCTDGVVPDCPALSRSTLSCDLNETTATMQYQGSYNLVSPSPTYVTGVGTQLGVQTATGLNKPANNPAGLDYCTNASPSLTNILNYGIANGAQFVEITPDLAADPDCGLHLARAVIKLTTQTKTQCQY